MPAVLSTAGLRNLVTDGATTHWGLCARAEPYNAFSEPSILRPKKGRGAEKGDAAHFGVPRRTCFSPACPEAGTTGATHDDELRRDRQGIPGIEAPALADPCRAAYAPATDRRRAGLENTRSRLRRRLLHAVAPPARSGSRRRCRLVRPGYRPKVFGSWEKSTGVVFWRGPRPCFWSAFNETA